MGFSSSWECSLWSGNVGSVAQTLLVRVTCVSHQQVTTLAPGTVLSLGLLVQEGRGAHLSQVGAGPVPGKPGWGEGTGPWWLSGQPACPCLLRSSQTATGPVFSHIADNGQKEGLGSTGTS